MRQKIRSGVYSVKKKATHETKSNVWERFSEVVATSAEGEDSNIGYAKCDSCDKLYKYDSHKTGTSSMARHVCAAAPKGTSRTRSIFSFLKNTNVPAQAKSDVIKAFVDLCCQDLRPMDIVSGDGFHSVAQCFINIGARYGCVDAKSLLPHRQTICDRAKETTKEKKEVLAVDINKALDCGIAITTDMWTDEFNKRSYTAFTAHYINADWKLESRVMTTAEFDSTLKKTAYNLHEQIVKDLHDFGIDAYKMQRVMFVSDQGANIKVALRSYKWMPCAAHVINIVLKHTFDIKEDSPVFMHEVCEVIDKCKSLVKYLKKSGTVVQLPYAVMQECETRWNSKAAMMQSVSKQYREILQAMQEKDQLHRMDGIQLDVLNAVAEFLVPFKSASEELEGDTYPTIHLVVLWFFKLKKHCEPQYNDPEYLVYIRARAAQLLQEKLSLSVTHKLGTFLCPRFKSMKVFSTEEKNAIYAHSRRLMRDFIPASSPIQSEASGGDAVGECRLKARNNVTLFLLAIVYIRLCPRIKQVFIMI